MLFKQKMCPNKEIKTRAHTQTTEVVALWKIERMSRLLHNVFVILALNDQSKHPLVHCMLWGGVFECVHSHRIQIAERGSGATRLQSAVGYAVIFLVNLILPVSMKGDSFTCAWEDI